MNISLSLTLSQYKWGVMDEVIILKELIFAGVDDGLLPLQI
jgi:hypothetical protein